MLATDGGEVTIDGTITGFAFYIMAGNTPKTVDEYTEDEIDGAAYRKYTDGENTVWVAEAPPEAAPTIVGPTALTLPEGYSATATEPYTITGTGMVVVTLTKTPDVGNITWNSTGQNLGIAAGLTAGSYQVTLTASNGVPPDATLTFTLTVEAAASGPMVCEIVGGSQYETLDAALAAVDADQTETIKLLADIDYDEGIAISDGQNITFDLNNHTLNVTTPVSGSRSRMDP